MLEKELKILEIDVEEIQKKLEGIGAIKVFDGLIHDIYFDFPGEKMNIRKKIFRTRKKGKTHFLYTIKNKKKSKHLKIAEEFERSISDIDGFHKVLEKYGMEKVREKKKHRISYSLGKVEFDIDDYSMGEEKNKIPPLLEIEASTKKEIYKYIDILGLSSHVIKKFGSRKLFKYYGVEYSYL